VAHQKLNIGKNRYQSYVELFFAVLDTYFVFFCGFRYILSDLFAVSDAYSVVFIFIKATYTQLRSYNAKGRGF